MMQYRTWIYDTTQTLLESGIDTARLDTLLLLEFVTGVARPALLAHDEYTLTDDALRRLDTLVSRRISHEPMAYILGKKEFYGRDFMVNSHVLVPRPESEDMISIFLELPSPKYVIDVGTGSGALAITAKLERSSTTVYGTDNDTRCIEIAQQNAKILKAEIIFIQSDLLSDLDSEVINQSVLLANLPYVPEDYPINLAARHEPAEAIFSPEDGLQHYRRLLEQLDTTSARPRAIICESLPEQHAPLEELAQKHGLKLKLTIGLQQLFD